MRKKRIKLLFVIDELALGGTEKQLMLLAKSLPRDIFDPVIATLSHNNYRYSYQIKTPLVEFKLIGPPIMRNLLLLLKIRRFLETERFHIVQTHFPDSEIYTGLALRMCSYKPIFIGTRRNLYYWIKERPLTFALLRQVSQWTHRILVNSHKLMEESRRREKIPIQKLELIQNAVEVDKFCRIPTEEAKKRIGLDGVFPVIGVVGNWRPIKGLKPFLQAASIISDRMPQAQFILAGSGPQKQQLQSLSSDLGISNNLTLYENCQDVSTLMAAFDIAVQPSLSESFSNVLLEYMAAERPIVATTVGDAETIIEHGKDGILVRPNQPQDLAKAVLILCHNRKRASQMAKRAREKATANWAPEKIIATYRLFYQECVHPNRNQ